MKLEDGHGTIMKDSEEDREIKTRTGAKEAEIMAESKKLLPGIGQSRRVIKKETLPTNR
jgi:hypothetical protein